MRVSKAQTQFFGKLLLFYGFFFSYFGISLPSVSPSRISYSEWKPVLKPVQLQPIKPYPGLTPKSIVKPNITLPWTSSSYPIAHSKTFCNGRQNLLDDIGLVGLVSAVASSAIGIYTVLVNSMTSNSVTYVTGFLSLALWLPGVIIHLFHLDQDSKWLYWLHNGINGASLINAVYGFVGVVFGLADVLASMAGEIIGLISFVFSVIATFPDTLDALVGVFRESGYRRQVEYIFGNYGCSIPRWFVYVLGKPLHARINDVLVSMVPH